MKLLSILLIGGGLIVTVGAAAVAVLVSCGLGAFQSVPWLNFCVSQAELDAQRARDAVMQENEALIREIAALEAELAIQQCVAVYDPPPVPDIILPSELPDVATDPNIDEEAWNDRDIGVLEGCWELDSDYRIQNRRTGAITEFNQWNMCFSNTGQGTQEMLATNGVTCRGQVTANFDAAGRLNIQEPGNLPCSDDSFIYERVISCELDGSGGAFCNERQPEVGTAGTVGLRRAVGDR
ncbi:MAG: hypothetical protein AAF376_02645 [Pseudomonadota bacterium]